MDGSRTLAALAFSTTGGGSYTISRSGGDTTSTLTLSNGTATVSIANSGGNQTIAVPVVLGNNLSVSATTGSRLTISGPISQTSPGTSVTLSGGGVLILSGSDTYTGGTTISDGTLEVADAAALPTKGIINVGRSGTVSLLGLLVIPGVVGPDDSQVAMDMAAEPANTVAVATTSPAIAGGTVAGGGGEASFGGMDSIVEAAAAAAVPGALHLHPPRRWCYRAVRVDAAAARTIIASLRELHQSPSRRAYCPSRARAAAAQGLSGAMARNSRQCSSASPRRPMSSRVRAR